MVRHVWPARISAIRSSSSATTHSEMWALIRWGREWNIGLVHSPDFLTRQSSTRISSL